MYFTLNRPVPAFEPPQSLADRIERAVQSIELGNNGYADIGTSAVVAEGVKARGYVVIARRNGMGLWGYRGFTQRAQAALADELRAGSQFAHSTYKAPVTRLELPDCEPAILARNARHLLG